MGSSMGFLSVPLVFISVFVPVPNSLDDRSTEASSDVRKVDSSSSILFSQDCFGYSGFFCVSKRIVKFLLLVL